MSDRKTTSYHKIVGITKKGNVVELEVIFGPILIDVVKEAEQNQE